MTCGQEMQLASRYATKDASEYPAVNTMGPTTKHYLVRTVSAEADGTWSRECMKPSVQLGCDL